MYASVIKLKVLFIKHASSKFDVRHCNVFDVVFARVNETLCLLRDVALSKNLEL